DRDAHRSFHGKWEISRLAISSEGKPLGFCIGFELEPDQEVYREPGVYLHRLAVDQAARGRMIGALLQADTVVKIFIRGLRYVSDERNPILIYGQTNRTRENLAVIRFHNAAGFVTVREKSYSDRDDVVFKMDANS